MSEMNAGTRLAALAERLSDTLIEELAALDAVRETIRGMLAAIRRSDPELLNEHATSLQGRIHRAADLREAQGRQIGLFFRTAGARGDTVSSVLSTLTSHPEADDVRNRIQTVLAAIRRTAAETGHLVAALTYALNCASRVNHDLVHMLHGLIQPDGGRVYTARGKTTSPRNRISLVNRVG